MFLLTYIGALFVLKNGFIRLYEIYMIRGIDMREHGDGVPSMLVDPFLTWNLTSEPLGIHHGIGVKV